MKRIALFLLHLTFYIPVLAQDDPVVMKIAGTPITRSEFEYNYNKNNTENVIDRKDLEDAKMDTASAFLDEFRTYRDQQIRPLLVPEGSEEAEVRDYYDGMLKQLDGHDLRLPAHIFLRVPQKSTAEEQEAKKVRQLREFSMYSIRSHTMGTK